MSDNELDVLLYPARLGMVHLSARGIIISSYATVEWRWG